MTDHIAEAAAWMTEYSTIVEGEGLTDATVIASPLAAIAHATIALAEQQRIANHLALGQFTWSHPTEDGGPPATLSLTLDGAREVLARAQEALNRTQEEAS